MNAKPRAKKKKTSSTATTNTSKSGMGEGKKQQPSPRSAAAAKALSSLFSTDVTSSSAIPTLQETSIAKMSWQRQQLQQQVVVLLVVEGGIRNCQSCHRNPQSLWKNGSRTILPIHTQRRKRRMYLSSPRDC